MIKIFQGGRGGDTFKTPSPYEQLLPLPTPCFKMFLERSLNDPTPPPHFRHLSLLPPSLSTTPPENFDHTHTSSWKYNCSKKGKKIKNPFLEKYKRSSYV